MAELDFSHHVSQIPEQASIPKTERHVNAAVTPLPSVQNAFNQYAEATNWMSSLGSKVASTASNKIAQRIGGELGQNPQGDIGLSLTEFDKTMEKSYTTQAQSTLGLQAQKLITQSNLELAALPRLDPGTIARSQQQVGLGLNKIFSLAPQSIRPNMEHQYGSLMLSQYEQLNNRMLRDQKTDRIDNLELSSKVNAQNAHSFAINGIDIDKHGDSKSAMAVLRSTIEAANIAAARHDITPNQAKVMIDTAKQSYLAGKYTREALIAQKEKRLPQYLKSLAENPPKDVSDADHHAVYSNVISYIQQQQALLTQDENLKSQQMYNRIITSPNDITGSEWAAFKEEVSPIKYEQMQFRLLQAQKKKTSTEDAVNFLILHNGDVHAQANSSAEVKNAAFNKSVAYTLKENPTMSLDDAENQVAMSFAAPVPVFSKTLKLKLWSSDPAQMISGAQQIADLQITGNGHALTELSTADKALASDIANNNNPADPAWAARMVAENKANQDENVRANTQASLNNYMYQNTIKNNTTTDDFVLGKVGLKGGLFLSGFDSPWMRGHYASDILSEFNTNYMHTRDADRAWELTQQYVKDNFGKSNINGDSEWTKHPLEKACGFNEGDGIQSIQDDIVRQVSVPLSNLKQRYDENKSDYYWTLEPIQNKVNEHPHVPIKNRLQFVKHTRNGQSTISQKFPLKLVGNSFNWDLNVETDRGPMSIYLEDPTIGVHKYTPDVKWIQENYKKGNG